MRLFFLPGGPPKNSAASVAVAEPAFLTKLATTPDGSDAKTSRGIAVTRPVSGAHSVGGAVLATLMKFGPTANIAEEQV